MEKCKNVIRLMDKKDLFNVPEARKEFEEHGNHGDYFFFVIENDQREILGYMIAKKEDEKNVVEVKQIEVEEVEEKQLYINRAIANLFDYVMQIRNCDGTTIVRDVRVL